MCLNLVKADEKAMYAGYTKSWLESLMKHKDFSSFPKNQQDKVKSSYNDLETDELLVMILE